MLLFSLLSLQAQRDYLPTVDDLERFGKSKTYVVLEDNAFSDYNFEIQEVVKKHWILTAYEVISYQEFKERRNDPQASFLFVAEVNLERDKSRARYKFLCLSMGGENATVDMMKDISNLPYAYSETEEDQQVYHLATLVRFLQQHVRALMDNPSLVSQHPFQVYNRNMSLLSEKTLYLVRDELASDITTEEQIRDVYPYPFRLVEGEELREMLKSGEAEDVVFLHKVGPQNRDLESRVYKMLLGVDDATLYYFNYHKANAKNPDAILKNDLRRIGKAPKSK